MEFRKSQITLISIFGLLAEDSFPVYDVAVEKIGQLNVGYFRRSFRWWALTYRCKEARKKNQNNASREPHMFRRNYPPSIKSAFQPQKTTFCSGSVLAAGIKIDFAVIGFKYENMFHFGSDAAHNEPRSGWKNYNGWWYYTSLNYICGCHQFFFRGYHRHDEALCTRRWNVILFTAHDDGASSSRVSTSISNESLDVKQKNDRTFAGTWYASITNV